jgi:hypothetical protein
MTLKAPEFSTNRYFYDVQPFTPKEHRFFYNNVERVEEKVLVKPKKPYGPEISIAKDLYLKKYIRFFEQDDISKPSIFNKTYKFPIHRLSIGNSYLKEVKKLPKELVALYIQSSGDFLKIPISVIPKNIISITMLWTAFPFNGVDLFSFKKLKHFRATGGSIVVLPKFPKNIEHIVLKDTGLSVGFPKSLNGFKLSKYPKLKYLEISGLSKKEVPEEWREAKRQKKLTIKY